MPDLKLTGRNAPNLSCPANKKEIVYWSGELTGFGLRCRNSGARTWFVQYRTKAGVTRKHTLGSPTDVTFAAAHKAADKLIAEARLGGDPAGNVKQAKAEAKEAITVGELVEKYLTHQRPRLRTRSYEELRRHLGGRRDAGESRPRHGKPLDVKPLHGLRAARLTQRDIVELLQGIAQLAPTQANRVRASVSGMYSWGMKAGLVAANPVAATFVPTEEKPRERVLSDNELVLVWRCTGGPVDHDRIVRLLILTGARRAEIAGINWQELTTTADGAVLWALPSERSKNGLPHMLRLPPLAVDQIPSRREGRDGLFGEAAGPFSGWSRCKARLDRRIANTNNNKPMRPWTLHDLRRTFVTRLNDLGVEPHIIEALVNHVGGIARAGIAGVYNRSAYVVQKAARSHCGATI